MLKGAVACASVGSIDNSACRWQTCQQYRLYYGYPGRRVVGYDNEAGKGDHRHLEGKEAAYAFVSVEALLQDFLADVKAKRDT